MKGLCHRRKHVAERNTMGLRFPTYVKLVLRYLNLLGQQKWNEELDSREQTLHLWAHNARYLEYLGDKASSAQQELSSVHSCHAGS